MPGIAASDHVAVVGYGHPPVGAVRVSRPSLILGAECLDRQAVLTLDLVEDPNRLRVVIPGGTEVADQSERIIHFVIIGHRGAHVVGDWQGSLAVGACVRFIF
ncbi:hypothetical protein LBMAG38_15650 [Chloroflexota bacterium]|nr:hypothetical protein LBMAG38_15650 [Chloroflexota bacterium]